ncbi:MAG: hypothetical protein II089_02640, partial [Selenomonas sp.]|nr:hypothetical protein [Selenomonas sp.]
KKYNEARKCPPPQQVGARIPKQAASISPTSLKRQEEVLPMAKLEQRRYSNKPQKHEFLGLITVRKVAGEATHVSCLLRDLQK